MWICRTAVEKKLSIWKKMFNKNFYSTTNVIENYIKTFKRKNTKIIVIDL